MREMVALELVRAGTSGSEPRVWLMMVRIVVWSLYGCVFRFRRPASIGTSFCCFGFRERWKLFFSTEEKGWREVRNN